MGKKWARRTRSVGALIGVVFLTLILTAIPAAAGTATATTYADTVLGVELPPGGGSGIDCSTAQFAPFFGGASGGLPGVWFAIVPHTKLSPSAAICPGGQFGLWTQVNGQAATVSGFFLTGSVVQTSSVCPGTQTYKVSATLLVQASVGGQVRNGTGSFQDVTLTHLVDANCNAFFAIVSGPVSLTF
jgi:hypothetical protein